MTTFVLIHGAGDSGWYWHLVEEELRARGHDTVAPDVPVDGSTLLECADAIAEAVGNPAAPVAVVGQSFAGFIAPLVAERLPTDVLVLVAGMVPEPGEAPDDWWEHTGYGPAVREQAAIDGGLTGNEDPFVSFYHDVPRPIAEEAMRRGRDGSISGLDQPWPLDAWPAVPTRYVLCTEDRFFPAAFSPATGRRAARHRAGRDRGRPLRRPQSSGRARRPVRGWVRSCEEGVDAMTKYLISFPSGAMDVSDEDLPAVSDASHAVVQEAKDAGVWVFGGGIDESVPPVMVDGDGTVTEGTYPQTKQLEGGYSVLELPSREAALEWAAKIAVACRCAQEVRAFMFDPAS